MATNQTNKTVRSSMTCNDFPVELVIATFVGLTILGVFNNILIALIVWKNKEMQNPTNFLLTNNAVAEILNILVSATMVTIFSLVFRTKILATETKTTLGRLLSSMRIFYFLPILINMITLAILAVERHNALIYPLKVHRRLSRRGTKVAICISWVASIILCLPLAEKRSTVGKLQEGLFYYLLGLATSTVFISSSVIIFCYGRIIFAIYVTKTVCNQTSNQTCTTARVQDWKNKRNIMKMLLSITLIFVFTKFPPLTYTFLTLSNNDPSSNCAILFTFCSHISALLNPVVYLLYSSNYRDGTQKLFRSCCSNATQYRVNQNI